MTEAIRIDTLKPEYFAALEALQQACYPTLAPSELMRIPQYQSQYRIFPDGQFVALEEDRVIGQGSGLLLDFDFDHPNHSFRQITDTFYFRTHKPNGEWYYGADISVHPGWRGRGVGKLLYDARMGIVRRLNRRGIVAGGMLPGYPKYREQFTPREYAERVAAGKLYDPTLSFQLRMGFQLRDMIANYMDDSATGGWATLIVWENDRRQPSASLDARQEEASA
jgi:GNAT superfamily N-acetyltransferase